MSDYRPKLLSKSEVRAAVDEHLKKIELAQLHDHLAAIQRRLAPSGEADIAGMDALIEVMSEERDRLAKLAKKG